MSTRATVATGGPGFTLTVPSSWFELDLAPATRDAAIATLVEQRVAEVPDLRPHRATIARLLRTQAREAWEAGARFCGALVDPTEDGPITAAVTVSIVTGPLGVRAGSPEQFAALVAPLTIKQAAHADDTWLEVHACEVRGAGQAARSRGVEDIDLPEDAGVVRVVSMQVLAPIPGTTSVLLVSCSSPVIELAEPLLDVFDAICGTLTVIAAGQTGRRP